MFLLYLLLGRKCHDEYIIYRGICFHILCTHLYRVATVNAYKICESDKQLKRTKRKRRFPSLRRRRSMERFRVSATQARKRRLPKFPIWGPFLKVTFSVPFSLDTCGKKASPLNINCFHINTDTCAHSCEFLTFTVMNLY